ncbi:hypothetical protein ACWEVD_00645 [Nocardia thailandica]
MSPTNSDPAVDAVHRELIDALGEDWDIDSFQPLDNPTEAPSPHEAGWSHLGGDICVLSTPHGKHYVTSVPGSTAAQRYIDEMGVLFQRAFTQARFEHARRLVQDGIVTFTIEIKLPVEALDKVHERAEAAGLSIEDLLSEWVTAEAGAEETISRDEVLALLARHQRHSA